MKRLAIALTAAAAVMAGAPEIAHSADMPYKARTRAYQPSVYERPVPRVYYQSARPTAICRTVFLAGERGWPRERSAVARCTRFD